MGNLMMPVLFSLFSTSDVCVQCFHLEVWGQRVRKHVFFPESEGHQNLPILVPDVLGVILLEDAAVKFEKLTTQPQVTTESLSLGKKKTHMKLKCARVVVGISKQIYKGNTWSNYTPEIEHAYQNVP